MKHLASPKAVAAGLVLVVVTNVVVVATAVWNRGGEPRAVVSLTERELALPEGIRDERSGVSLELVLTHEAPGRLERVARWRRHDLPPVEYGWCDRGKLEDLGFRTAVDPTDPKAAESYAMQLNRPVWLVLEYEGEAWNRWLADREARVEALRRSVEAGNAERGELADAEAILALDRTMRSRLFPVDAGLDAEALQRRYGDSARNLIVRGMIRAEVVPSEYGTRRLLGKVSGPIVRWIHVPREIAGPIEPLFSKETFHDMEMRERREAEEGWPAPAPPRYGAELAVGRRFEPWLTGVAVVEATGDVSGND